MVATHAVCPSTSALVAIVSAKTNSRYASVYDSTCDETGNRRAIVVIGRRTFSVKLSSTANFSSRRI